MRKIKVFAPHLELKVTVSDQMEKDYRECAEMANEVGGDCKDCDQCSWNDVKVGYTNICELPAMQKLLEV